VEGVGRSVSGSDVADSDGEGGGILGKGVGGSLSSGDGDDLAAEESGGDGLVEGVGVLVVDGRGVDRVGSGRSRRTGAGGRGLAGGRSTRRGHAATGAGRAGTRRAVGDAGSEAGSTRAGARDGRRDSAADDRALGGSKSGESADEDSGELHVDFPGVDGQDELGVGSIKRLMGEEREGGDEEVKGKERGRLVVFLKDGPQARRFLQKLAFGDLGPCLVPHCSKPPEKASPSSEHNLPMLPT
jgi:hypothetical protein